jgi:hypothetical protein
MPNDECLLQALAHTQSAEKTPDCIISFGSDKSPSLYLGGYRGVMNTQFLKDAQISRIVNTAKGLEIFGAKYLARICCLYLRFCHINRIVWKRQKAS